MVDISSIDLDAWAEEAASQLMAEQAAAEAYANSPEFRAEFNLLKTALIGYDTYVDWEALAYKVTPMHQVIDAETFTRVTDGMRHHAVVVEEVDCEFETTYHVFEGVHVSTIYGQGAFVTASIATDEQIKRYKLLVEAHK